MTQVHSLRNRMTTALLTAGAMVDGLLPADAKNLRDLAQTLDDLNGILATVPKYDLEPDSAASIIDVHEMIRAVCDDLALIASATSISVNILDDPAAAGCRVLRGNRRHVGESFEGALRVLLTVLPAGAAVDIAPRSAGIVILTVTTPEHEPKNLTALLTGMAAQLERHRGMVHRGAEPGRYCLHLPGKQLCDGGASRAVCCLGER